MGKTEEIVCHVDDKCIWSVVRGTPILSDIVGGHPASATGTVVANSFTATVEGCHTRNRRCDCTQALARDMESMY